MKGFASDNYSGAHPKVLAAVAAANDLHAVAYGADPWTARAEQLVREHFGEQARPYLVWNGTGANVTILRAMCRPWHAVLCAHSAHINADEGGAPEFLVGCKLIDLPTPDGKLTPELVERAVVRVGDEHAVQPRVVSITQSTELGTVYRPEEVRALAELAHRHSIYLHLDGARLANAAAALELPLRAFTTDVGVDAVSFGGTKNGLLYGEAVVLLAPELAEGFAWVRKQSMQLASKGRYLGAQFTALLEGDLWLRSAAHANAMAQRLADAVTGLAGVRMTQRVQANVVFAVLNPAVSARLQRGPFTSGTTRPARCAGCARGTPARLRSTRSPRRSERRRQPPETACPPSPGTCREGRVGLTAQPGGRLADGRPGSRTRAAHLARFGRACRAPADRYGVRAA